MISIPTTCITYNAEQTDIFVLGIYNKLYEGETVVFDLINQGNTFACENNKDHRLDISRMTIIEMIIN